MNSLPIVSIVLVAWNSKPYLAKCLEALDSQTFRDFEVILVDNGSDDDALSGLNARFPSLALFTHRLNSNLGFAVANNIGARFARGKWLALLNIDAFPEAGWLENLVDAAEKNPRYIFFASRQIQANKPELLDGAGDEYHVSGLAWRKYYDCQVKDYGNEMQEVFSACAAAALYLRADFLKLGGFDEDYFSYCEDVDLGFRFRLAGEKCLYVPQAVVHHVGSASTGRRSDLSVYYGYRNLIWTFIKDMPSPWIWISFPFHVVTILFFTVYLAGRGQGHIIWRAILDAVRGLPVVIGKRKMIQKEIKIRPGELLKVMSVGLFAPIIEFAQRNVPQ